jgi:hypothetical protein
MHPEEQDDDDLRQVVMTLHLVAMSLWALPEKLDRLRLKIFAKNRADLFLSFVLTHLCIRMLLINVWICEQRLCVAAAK